MPKIRPSDNTPMKLIIGLGNHGKTYAANRHNIGFRCVNFLSRHYSIPLKKNECRAQTGSGKIAGTPVLLAKPKTFVNLSGAAVSRLMKKHPVAIDDVIVIHDDLDLPLGKLRIRKGGRSGGHKGINSIITAIGDSNFCRIKVGIGRPVAPDGTPITDEKVIVDYVLGDFTHEEEEAVKPIITRVAEAVECLLTEGLTAAMNRFN